MVVVASEEVIPLERISRPIGKVGEVSIAWIYTKTVVNAWINTKTVWPHIQVDGKTGKDESEPNVGRPDVALVVVVQTPC